MKINRESAFLFVGLRGSGKTYLLKHFLKFYPKLSVYIFDYNGNDYQEFAKKGEHEQHVWNNQTSRKDEVDKFLKIPYARKNCTVVLEEADQYLKVSGSEFTKHFVGTARNRGIGFICSSKRPFGINPDFRSAFDRLFIFHTNDPEDIDYLEKWVGRELPQISRLAVARTAKDGKGEYIEVDTITKEVSGVKKL